MTLYGPDNQPLRPAPETVDSDARWFDTTLELLREATEAATGSQAAIDAGSVAHHNAGRPEGVVTVDWGDKPLVVGLLMSYVTAVGTAEFKANGYAAVAARTLVTLVEQIDRQRPLPARVRYTKEAKPPYCTIQWVGTDPVDRRRPGLVVTLTATMDLLDGRRQDREGEQSAAVRAVGELLGAPD